MTLWNRCITHHGSVTRWFHAADTECRTEGGGAVVLLTPGAPRCVGVAISHTSSATPAAVGVSVEG